MSSSGQSPPRCPPGALPPPYLPGPVCFHSAPGHDWLAPLLRLLLHVRGGHLHDPRVPQRLPAIPPIHQDAVAPQRRGIRLQLLPRRCAPHQGGTVSTARRRGIPQHMGREPGMEMRTCVSFQCQELISTRTRPVHVEQISISSSFWFASPLCLPGGPTFGGTSPLLAQGPKGQAYGLLAVLKSSDAEANN